MRAWVLAGGQSRRLGQDKALVEVAGEAVLVRTVRILREAGLEPLVLCRSPRSLGLPEHREPDGPRHPAWGIAEALTHGDAFITPCDLLDLHVNAVVTLLTARAIALGQPLLGVYPASLRAAALHTAQTGGTIRSLVAGLPAVDVGSFRNLNRSEDLPAS